MNENVTAIMSDSHGNLSVLKKALEIIRSMKISNIYHLGDFCDTNMKKGYAEIEKIVLDNNIRCVIGNNEVDLLIDFKHENRNNIKPGFISLLKEFPYVIKDGEIWYAHSIPHSWPAATKRPISDYLSNSMGCNMEKFRILFRGHSHSPQVIEILSGKIVEKNYSAGDSVKLNKESISIVTVGALEDNYFALYYPDAYEVRFMKLDS